MNRQPLVTLASVAVSVGVLLLVGLVFALPQLFWVLLAGVAVAGFVVQTVALNAARRELRAARQLPRERDPRLVAADTPEHLSTRAGEVVSRNVQRLPPAVLKRAHLILKRLEEVEALDRAGRLDPERSHLARKIATEYLPEALEGYLKLPPSQAKTRELAPGKTGYDLLLEQLAKLSGAAKELLEEATLAEGHQLLGNHRFLQEKFRSAGNEFDL